MLDVLEFNLTGPTSYDFLQISLFLSNFKDLANYFSSDLLELFEKICVYFLKMVYYDYDIISKNTNSLLAAGIIFVSLKVLE